MAAGFLLMAKILLVEDNADAAAELQSLLKQQRHTVERVATVRSAKDFLLSSPYDLLLLDWNLPDGTGIELLRSLREQALTLPVLMLTSRTELVDKLEGFRSGTDDYLTKPFEGEELICRIQALLRRPNELRKDTLVYGHISLDSTSRQVFIAGKSVHLTPKEFATLEFFMRHQGQTFSSAALLDRIWQADNEATPATVVATILRLRRKIDRPDQQSVIQNVFGVGYRLAADSSD
jgi:DNA-binding response OmpR family regulator